MRDLLPKMRVEDKPKPVMHRQKANQTQGTKSSTRSMDLGKASGSLIVNQKDLVYKLLGPLLQGPSIERV